MRITSFLASAVATGTVAGVGLGVSSAQIRDTLGSQCVADRRKKSLRLDYGLLEFGLFADVCETVAIQVHRLAGGVDGMIPSVLGGKFQDFSGTVQFESVRREIEREGVVALEEVESQSGYRCYRVIEPHVGIYVVDEHLLGGDPFAPGDLWSVVISRRG